MLPRCAAAAATKRLPSCRVVALRAAPRRGLALRGEPPRCESLATPSALFSPSSSHVWLPHNSRGLEDIGSAGSSTGAVPLRHALDRGLENIGKASEGGQAAGSIPVNWKKVRLDP